MLDLPLRKELFWDMDFSKLDPCIHKTHIIQQVLNLGTLEEFRNVLDYYGFDQVKESVKKVGYLDPKTFSFVLWYFNLNKSDLKCYTKNQLHPKHWI